ncbi:MAG: hypothetical protein JWO10_1425 [Microbacteriaceae bacterium]|nr:hypothetical protein [Microbacteriaceae bacterium]
MPTLDSWLLHFHGRRKLPVPRLVPVKPSRYWLVYTLIRVGLFAVALAGLLLLGVDPWISAIAAAVIGLCVSYIFFRGQRDAVATSIVKVRAAPNRDLDNDLENEALDRFEGDR